MDHEHSLSANRIEAFTDAVLAIIVTLLVLDLKVPETLGEALSAQDALTFLWHLAPQFIGFALSFFIVCIFWVNHHQFFASVVKCDRKLVWLNNLTLFFLSFIPFPTAFLGRFPTNLVAVMLFGLVLFFAALSFNLMITHAMFKGNLVDSHISEKERKMAKRRGMYGIILYAASVLLAPLSIYISLAIFLLVPLIYFVPRRFQFEG